MGPDVNVLDYLDAAVNSVQESVVNGNVTINVDGIELSLSDDPIVPESEYSILCDVGHIPSNGSCGNFCFLILVIFYKRVYIILPTKFYPLLHVRYRCGNA